MQMRDFLELSNWIGVNWYLCQATGGNTSIKHNNRLFIKASGKKLSDTLNNKKNVFVYLDDTKSSLKPSMEFGMHENLNSKFVFHYHPINAILCSILKQSNALKKILKSKNITTINIEYIEPGELLSSFIKEKISKLNSQPELIILDNHGVVISNNNLERIYKIINILEDATFELLKNIGVNVDYLNLIWSKSFIDKETTSLKISEKLYDYFCLGLRKLNKDSFFFPDQIVYLESTVKLWSSLLLDDKKNYYLNYDPIKKVILLNSDLSDIQRNYLWVSAYLLCGIGMNSKKSLNLLKGSQVKSIINNPAEIYRKNISC